QRGRFTGWAASGAWAGRPEVQEVGLSAHGDPFVRKLLPLLQQRDPGQLVFYPSVPAEHERLFGGSRGITIPLSLTGRIYGPLILQTETQPPIADEIKEMVNLVISHCTVALERTELFEQTLTSARQASTLHSIASDVRASLDPETVVQTMASGAVSALPLCSCEVYLF